MSATAQAFQWKHFQFGSVLHRKDHMTSEGMEYKLYQLLLWYFDAAPVLILHHRMSSFVFHSRKSYMFELILERVHNDRIFDIVWWIKAMHFNTDGRYESVQIKEPVNTMHYWKYPSWGDRRPAEHNACETVSNKTAVLCLCFSEGGDLMTRGGWITKTHHWITIVILL